jgi:hypothetical protein
MLSNDCELTSRNSGCRDDDVHPRTDRGGWECRALPADSEVVREEAPSLHARFRRLGSELFAA